MNASSIKLLPWLGNTFIDALSPVFSATSLIFFLTYTINCLGNETDSAIQKPGQESVVESFDKIWLKANEYYYSESLRKRQFTDEKYLQLKAQAKQKNNIHEFSPVFNEFLKSLNVSHTQFYTSNDIDFYFFRSLFSTREINKPKVFHIGGQFKQVNNQYIVREVLDGYPLDQAGIRRGDIIENVDDGEFHPYLSFNQTIKPHYRLRINRNGRQFVKSISPVFENPSYSFAQSVKHSAKIIKLNDKRVGYVRLWTGVHADVLQSFTQVIKTQFESVDGIILDLRGGYGGAWYEYIDPFFTNRQAYFNYSVIDKAGNRKQYTAEDKNNPSPFLGPMVVLINEGVRSGKEALSYQFKKTNRALLVGEKTMGAFVAGRGIFNEEQDYFLYLATAEYFVDDIKIEGVGIKPHVAVAYPLSKSLNHDPQLNRALVEISKLLNDK
ncbi:S41 family peptidase [Aliikangiella marina]|uniref:S41 family peptidase n=1 Tax=Aliikangiella marina TaxID=1712262 RepID=UPI00163D5B23|nr:S41 family peptidase [Aliikangiella marina]